MAPDQEGRQQPRHGTDSAHSSEIRDAVTEEAAWAQEVQGQLRFFEDMALQVRVSAEGFASLQTANPVMDRKAEAAYSEYLADYVALPGNIPATFLIVSGLRASLPCAHL